MTNDNKNKLTLKFRCPPGLEELLPPPIPSAQGVPDWLKSMPASAYSSISLREEDTVKRCPPFIDAMTSGFLILLFCDLRVDDGGITWDNEIPAGGALEFPRSPISFHDSSQVSGTPLFEPGRFMIKFHNLWTVEAPEGYGVLFTHPFNRFDLPFTTLTGLVDCDLYSDNWVHFPAYWHNTGFRGVVPKGTPVAQCIPVKREDWMAQKSSLTDEEVRKVHAVRSELSRESSLYRRKFRA
jgi:hypothetical protein